MSELTIENKKARSNMQLHRAELAFKNTLVYFFQQNLLYMFCVTAILGDFAAPNTHVFAYMFL